ncbi:hypothetical protein MPH_13377 [Macrophomina phaseolina MS6]|uniref:Uncharacterized protein n=2 Tax=Macrophomina phaseolina TaxID=35725 RepID=K2RYU9_MACPH|nr:hypothetical protein MPH_13377 [Macrophomina phaseolina MS6]KAH7053466.1 hypothetical protein B0J12DRAFT_751100 [Macrophomina phaseolina]
MTIAQKAADGPPELNSIDERIGMNAGSTVALEALHTRVGSGSKTSSGDFRERIEELTRENCRLRLEIQFYRDCFVHSQRFLSRVMSVRTRIEERFADGRLSEGEKQTLFELSTELLQAAWKVELGMKTSQEAWERFYIDNMHA